MSAAIHPPLPRFEHAAGERGQSELLRVDDEDLVTYEAGAPNVADEICLGSLRLEDVPHLRRSPRRLLHRGQQEVALGIWHQRSAT